MTPNLQTSQIIHKEKAIAFLYDSVKEEIPISREGYESSLIGWEIIPIEVREELVAVMIKKERELHLSITQEMAVKHGMRIIRNNLMPEMRSSGYVTTRSPKDEKYQYFIERLGFYKTNEDSCFIEYRMDQSIIERKRLCHQ